MKNDSLKIAVVGYGYWGKNLEICLRAKFREC